MRCLLARPDGSLEVFPGARPAARSGRRVQPLDDVEVVPLPDGATLAHLPGRSALALNATGETVAVPERLPVAAVLPVGWLRTLCPASQPQPGAPRLPLYGYAAVAELNGEPVVAALRSDAWSWWDPAGFGRPDLAAAVAAARAALPGNRVVEQLAVCALEHDCYTAQNTFHRRHEGALPSSPACNADCLGCISLQPEPVPTPQPRMRHAPTAAELAEVADWHLSGPQAASGVPADSRWSGAESVGCGASGVPADSRWSGAESVGWGAMVSFGQGCEGEPLTRADCLEEAVALIHRRHPAATIHVNTNGSNPAALQRLIGAGCASVRISAISFSDAVFRAYYRPIGYGLDEVRECGRVMARAGGQVCLNLLTFPGLTDVAQELELTAAACREMGVSQVQWRSLNVDHDWLVEVLPEMPEGLGMRAARRRLRAALPGVAHGNFTRPVAPLPPAAAPAHVDAAPGPRRP